MKSMFITGQALWNSQYQCGHGFLTVLLSVSATSSQPLNTIQITTQTGHVYLVKYSHIHYQPTLEIFIYWNRHVNHLTYIFKLYMTHQLSSNIMHIYIEPSYHLYTRQQFFLSFCVSAVCT